MSRLDEAQTEQDGTSPDTSPGTSPGTEPAAPTPRRRSRLVVGLLTICVVLGLLLAGGGLGLAWWLQRGYDNNIERFGDPFGPLTDRPKVTASPGAMNILLLGSDSRISTDPGAWTRGAQRTDAIMIAHIPDDRSAVTVTSIPRDSWVTIPGHGKNKINAGFSFGGPTLMVKTVEKLTGVRIDHVVIVDFEGFREITDDLGGVNINVSKATSDGRASFAAGPQTMDGETALNYVRQRHNLPGGDFDRVKRQQNWIRAVALKTLNKGTLTNPLTVNAVLDSLTSSIAADDGFSIGKMRSLAISLRSIRGGDLTFLTAPVAGTGRSPDGKQSIVNLAAAENRVLWKAVAADDLDSWLTAHPEAALGRSVR